MPAHVCANSHLQNSALAKISPYSKHIAAINLIHCSSTNIFDIFRKEIDWQTPTQKAPVQANVTIHDDRVKKFEEKKVQSLGGAPKKGPAITFRKRKINSEMNIRSKTDED